MSLIKTAQSLMLRFRVHHRGAELALFAEKAAALKRREVCEVFSHAALAKT